MNYGKFLRISKPGRRVRQLSRASACWGLALALLLVALPAAAAETVLMLGVLRDGKLEAKVSRAVHERLTRAGETAPPTTHLQLTDRQCAVPECLDGLAGREKAQLVLSARVQQSAGFAYIAAFLYDPAHQRSLDASAVCDKCLPEAVALRIGDLYARLLRDHRDRLRAEAAGPRRPVKTAVAASPAPGPGVRSRRRSPQVPRRTAHRRRVPPRQRVRRPLSPRARHPARRQSKRPNPARPCPTPASRW